jgi:hypothetical protein
MKIFVLSRLIFEKFMNNRPIEVLMNQPEAPQVGLIVLRIMGFGVTTVIGFDPIEAQVGDNGIKTMHNKFISMTQT